MKTTKFNWLVQHSLEFDKLNGSNDTRKQIHTSSTHDHIPPNSINLFLPLNYYDWQNINFTSYGLTC